VVKATEKVPKVLNISQFWTNFIFFFFAIGLGFTLRIIIDLLKR